MEYDRILFHSRNIANLDYLNEYIEFLIATIEDRRTESEITKWIESNLRNYLINKYENVKKVKTYKKSDPDWLKKAVDNKEEVFNIVIKRTFVAKMQHVIDYFKSLDDRDLKKIVRVSVPDAIKKSEKWIEELNKKASGEEDESGVSIVRTYKDGFNWKQLTSQKALDREGKLMRHCVGSYCDQVSLGNTNIFSLRDPNNKPHITIEVTKKGDINQIKGFANSTIKKKYVLYVKDFITKPIEGFKYNKIDKDDLEDIGVIVQKGEWYNINNLPVGFTTKSIFLGVNKNTILPENLRITERLSGYGTTFTLSKGSKIRDLEYSDSTVIIEENVSIAEAEFEDCNITLSKGFKCDYLTLRICDINNGKLPDDIKVKNLEIVSTNLTSLPKIEGLKVRGDLYASGSLISSIPKGLKVGGYLDLSNSEITSIPDNVKVGDSLKIVNTPCSSIGKGLEVGKHLYTQGTKIISIPKDLKIGGDLYVNSLVKELPEGLEIGGNLNLEDTTIKFLPNDLKVGGKLIVNARYINGVPSHLADKVEYSY